MSSDSDKIYNEINEYCEFTENLSKEAIKSDNVSIEDKKKILFPLINELKEIGDKLIEQYVAHLKDKDNQKLVEDLKETLQIILTKIDYCKNKVYELYRKKEFKEPLLTKKVNK